MRRRLDEIVANEVLPIETDDVFEGLTGPYLATFTARIPFLLGVPDDLGHTIKSPHAFVDPEAAQAFGPRTFVNIRVFAQFPMRRPAGGWCKCLCVGGRRSRER